MSKVQSTRRKGGAAAPHLERDLFGEVPITAHDIYAWLLCVANVDPESGRAASYVRDYGVLPKITAAKLDGTMMAVADKALRNPRYLELLSEGMKFTSRRNPFGVGEHQHIPVKKFDRRPAMWRNRPAEVIQKDKVQRRAEKRQRQDQDMSMLQRLPKTVPPLAVMLDDIGNPSARHFAKAMGVSEATAKRWIAAGEAPQAVMLALFWVTRWGASTVDANAHNDAVQATRQAALASRELAVLQAEVHHIEKIADFGSANDPTPSVAAMLAKPAAPPRPAPTQPRAEVQIRYTSLERTPCADFDHKRRSA